MYCPNRSGAETMQNNMEVTTNSAILGGNVAIATINGHVTPSEMKDTTLQRLRVISKTELETDSYLVMPSSRVSTPRSLSTEAAMIRGARAPFLK